MPVIDSISIGLGLSRAQRQATVVVYFHKWDMQFERLVDSPRKKLSNLYANFPEETAQ